MTFQSKLSCFCIDGKDRDRIRFAAIGGIQKFSIGRNMQVCTRFGADIVSGQGGDALQKSEFSVFVRIGRYARCELFNEICKLVGRMKSKMPRSRARHGAYWIAGAELAAAG